MPTPVEVRQAVMEVARSQLRLDADLPDGDLAEQLDSVQRLTLVVALEDHFRISFDAEDDENISTLDDVVALVLRKLGEPGGPVGHDHDGR